MLRGGPRFRLSKNGRVKSNCESMICRPVHKMFISTMAFVCVCVCVCVDCGVGAVSSRQGAGPASGPGMGIRSRYPVPK